jgi:hypothetical protein
MRILLRLTLVCLGIQGVLAVVEADARLAHFRTTCAG